MTKIKERIAAAALAAALVAAGTAFPSVSRGAPLLAAAGDIACDPGNPHFNGGRGTAKACRQLATSRLLRGADTVVPLGDTQYEHSTFRNYQRSYNLSWGRFLSVTRPVIGNHEYGPPDNPNQGAGGYWRYFGEARAGRRGQGWYSFDVGSWHVIGLNSLCRESNRPQTMQRKVGCSEGSPQLDWLERDLAQNQQPCILASWHHPRFSSGSSRGFSEVAPLWRVLEDAGADVVLSGHDHVYERFAPRLADGSRSPDGIRQFVVGTGGEEIGRRFGSVEPSSQERARKFGVLRLRLASDSYRWRFTGANNEGDLDQGSTSCA